MFYIELFIYYIIAINIITFIVYGIDKWIAIRNGNIESLHYSHPLSRGSKGRRIPEVTLLMLAAIGGSIGAWCGMMVFRHKTKHWKFKLGVPVIFLLQFASLVFVYWKY